MRLVSSAAGLAEVSRALASADVVYLDTEFDSTREGTRLSLVQLSAGDEVFLVDAFEIADLTPLAPALRQSTWVLHAGQQDVALLSQRLEIGRPERVFDTQVAWALLTVEYSPSLAYLKYRLLGLRGEKPHQADDWTRRPLRPTQLAYAADDVLHLPELYRSLLARAEPLGRVSAILEASLEPFNAPAESASALTIEAFRNAWQLERDGQAVLRFLIAWYNGLPAQERGNAPDQKGLLSIANRRPRTMEDLSGLRAVPRRTVTLHGRALLRGIDSALASAEQGTFTQIEPAPYGNVADILVQGWLDAIRAEVCAELGIAPELAFPAKLTRRMRDAALAENQLDAAASVLTGWRKTLLAAAFQRIAGRYGPLPTPSNGGFDPRPVLE